MQENIRTVSPSTGQVIFEHNGTTIEQAQSMVTRASAAFKSYRKTTLGQRKSIVVKALDYLVARRERLSEELCRQMGRPIASAGVEIDTMRKRAEYLLELAPEALADLPGRQEAGFERWISKEALGPVLIISAWNYPWLITVNTLVPALLAGNSVLLKPSPQTPLVAEAFQEAFNAAGLPPDVFQVLHSGGLQTLQHIARLPGIKQLSFTGSTSGGLALRRAVADRIVPLNLELGGNDPAYVRGDSDLKWAASNIVDAAIFNSGQSCCAVERVYVHANVHDEFVREVQLELQNWKLGDPLDKSTTLGPVISHSAKRGILAQVDDALQKGAVDATPVNDSFTSPPQSGSYMAPRLLINVTHEMDVMKTETFGPVIPIMKVQGDEEAVALMNDSNYGLTASVWTRDVACGRGIADELEAGTVFVNRADCPNPDLAWIGWKESGLGSTLGPGAFDAFVIMKSHHIRNSQG